MDISREEQRVLHVLAQGGVIEPFKDKRGRIEKVACINRDGFMLPFMDMLLFKKLKRRHTIASQGGGPYRITRRGLELVRSEFDNR
ncbi:MAG TPA: YjhX family toxin [Devosia sp.]|nr:YjhX family toxin [Devosia sp.]